MATRFKNIKHRPDFKSDVIPKIRHALNFNIKDEIATELLAELDDVLYSREEWQLKVQIGGEIEDETAGIIEFARRMATESSNWGRN